MSMSLTSDWCRVSHSLPHMIIVRCGLTYGKPFLTYDYRLLGTGVF